MNIDLGYLGKAVLEELFEPFVANSEGFNVLYEGGTVDGIRVIGVVKHPDCYIDFPCVWRNAILIEV